MLWKSLCCYNKNKSHSILVRPFPHQQRQTSADMISFSGRVSESVNPGVCEEVSSGESGSTPASPVKEDLGLRLRRCDNMFILRSWGRNVLHSQDTR